MWAGHPDGFLQVNPMWAGHPDGFLQVNPVVRAEPEEIGSSRLILLGLGNQKKLVPPGLSWLCWPHPAGVPPGKLISPYP